MKQLTQAYKKLESQHSKYMDAKGSMEKKLYEKIDFEFCVTHFPDDGFAILNIETTAVAQLHKCLFHIEKHGKLTEQDHKDYSI